MKKHTASALTIARLLGIELDPETGRPGRDVCPQQQQSIQILTTQSDQAGYEVDVRLQDGTTIQVNPLPASAVIPGGLPTGEGAAVSYVWRPGGVAAQGVFTTWATLAAAFATTDPAQLKVVSVDDSIAAAHITAGAWPNCDNISWRSGGDDSGGSSLATVIIDQGASFTGPVAHMHAEGVAFSYAATSGALITTAAGQSFSMILYGVLMVGTGGGGTGIVSAGAGAAISLRAYSSSLQNQLFSGTATSSFAGALFDGTSFGPNCLDMTAGAAAFIIADGSCFVSTAQTPAPSVTILDPTPTFVWQPGGTAGGNVYTSWTALMAAAAFCPGVKDLVLDASGAGFVSFTVDVGTWNLNGFTIVPLDITPVNRNLIFPPNAFIDGTKLRTLYCRSTVFLESSNTVSPVCVFPAAAQSANVEFEAGGVITVGAGAKPFFQVQNGYNLFLRTLWNAIFQTGTGPSIQADAGGTVTLRTAGLATVQASTCTGGGTFNMHQSAESVISGTQPGVTGAFNIIVDATAAQIGYTPGTGGNWNPVPTLTNAALDQLAAPNFVQSQTTAGSGTGTTTAVTGNIAQKRSGKVNVSGIATGIPTSATTTVVVSLLRDATPIFTWPAITVLSTVGFAIPIGFVDTLPDTANHTYTVKAVAAAGNITSGATGNSIEAIEL